LWLHAFDQLFPRLVVKKGSVLLAGVQAVPNEIFQSIAFQRFWGEEGFPPLPPPQFQSLRLEPNGAETPRLGTPEFGGEGLGEGLKYRLPTESVEDKTKFGTSEIFKIYPDLETNISANGFHEAEVLLRTLIWQVLESL